MPIMRQIRGRPRLKPIAMENFADMTLSAMVEYEDKLWQWAEKVGFQPEIVTILNAIYREVEWRATSREWYDKMSKEN